MSFDVEQTIKEAFPDVDFNEYRPEGVKNEDYFRAIEEFITDQQMPKYEVTGSQRKSIKCGNFTAT